MSAIFWGENDDFFLSFCGLDKKIFAGSPGVCFQKSTDESQLTPGILNELNISDLESTLNWPEDASCKIPGRSIS